MKVSEMFLRAAKQATAHPFTTLFDSVGGDFDCMGKCMPYMIDVFPCVARTDVSAEVTTIGMLFAAELAKEDE